MSNKKHMLEAFSGAGNEVELTEEEFGEYWDYIQSITDLDEAEREYKIVPLGMLKYRLLEKIQFLKNQ